MAHPTHRLISTQVFASAEALRDFFKDPEGARQGVVAACAEINYCVGCTR